MGKAMPNECNERIAFKLPSAARFINKEGRDDFRKRLDDFRNQIHIIPLSHSSPDFSAYPHPVPYPQPHSKQAAAAEPRSAAEPAHSGSWNLQYIIRYFLHLLVTLSHHGKDAAVSRLHLLHVRDNLFIQLMMCRKENDWHILIYQSDRTCFISAAG